MSDDASSAHGPATAHVFAWLSSWFRAWAPKAHWAPTVPARRKTRSAYRASTPPAPGARRWIATAAWTRQTPTHATGDQAVSPWSFATSGCAFRIAARRRECHSDTLGRRTSCSSVTASATASSKTRRIDARRSTMQM